MAWWVGVVWKEVYDFGSGLGLVYLDALELQTFSTSSVSRVCEPCIAPPKPHLRGAAEYLVPAGAGLVLSSTVCEVNVPAVCL